jgi:5-methylcytosine-specific restriction enzyme B
VTEPVRTAPFLRACLEVLREASEPLPGREVLARAGQRVPPTPYESQPYSAEATGPRWQNHLRWWTGDAATIGWMTKRDGLWSLTPAGEAALDAFAEDELLAELKRRYREIRQQRSRAVAELSGDEQLIADALGFVEAGAWTAFDDLAELVGTSAENVAHFLAGTKRGLPGAWRVLRPDGRPPGDGMLHMDHRGTDVPRKLKSEGVELDVMGRASQTQRMTAAALRERLKQLQPDRADAMAPRRAWLVRGSSVEGHDLVPVWLQKGTVSLAAARLRPITLPMGSDELATVVTEDYSHLKYAPLQAKIAELDAFCLRMRPGDEVLTTSQGKTYVGRITGVAAYTGSSDDRSNLRRTVDWFNPTRPVPFGRLPQPLPARLHSQADVLELTEDISAIDELAASLDQATPHPAPAPPLSFTAATDELADRLLMDRGWLQRQLDLLWNRKQIILYGPPGTGKTWLARELAAHLAEPAAVKLVQFHPSYTYEDFFEGFRPTPGAGGELRFELRPGPLRTLVEAAQQRRHEPHVLIIDEINRANLAKVFGELYFLLEYRDQAVDLLYSAEAGFTLPENVFLVGTMNTADRSIALVDAAMRRRFGFVELHPDSPPTAGLLGAWLERLEKAGDVKYNADAPELLDELNSRIDERDLAVGPSYLMRPEIYRTPDGLDTAWETAILPLLAEQHHGAPELLGRFRLSALRRAVRQRAVAQPDDADAETVES